MRSRTWTAAIGAALLALALPGGVLAQDGASDGADGSLLYVVNATSGSIDGSTLTLVGVPSVLFFADRPERFAGHMSVDGLVNGWGLGERSFTAVPPNAVLSVFGDAGVEDAVVVLTGVTAGDGELSFEIELIEGDAPTGSFGPVALFIDNADQDAALDALCANPDHATHWFGAVPAVFDVCKATGRE